ncbi:protein maelstrom [Episyrphus balteatus]|uniref:protein maelstrom n=1 Tax=Episyrphus balteatus TaxID=286459 RepID=UPI00248539C9|nr:protein maelstrom [Episyrphus balteatus]
MPPKKKTNGFMVFTFEWKEKYGRHMSLSQATTEAGKIWATMTPQERGPYNEKSKNDRISAKNANDKLTCTGVPLQQIEKAKLEEEQNIRSMKKNIDKIVRDSLKRNELADQKYYFIMVNYFTKTLQGGVYLPAEVSVCQFSLKDGICRKFHSFVNPGVTIYGHSYEAQQHSDTTHQLPLPPNAMGEQQLGKLYNLILHFIRPDDGGEYPPVFTNVESMQIVESAMNFIKADAGANNVDLKIYSIQYLFFTLKEATCEVGEVEKPASIFVTDAYFDRDIFEYMVGIACDFHEKNDKSNYCTLSCVTRWCYMFSEYMAPDLAIKCIPGRHLPSNTRIESSVAAFSDTESFVSMGSESTYATKALSEHRTYYDDQKSTVSSRGAKFNNYDFPDLTGRPRKKPQSQQQLHDYSSYMDKGDDSVVNHWADRSRRVPPQPDKSEFKIDVSENKSRFTDLNDTDTESTISLGRGRIKTSFGRGNSFSK